MARGKKKSDKIRLADREVEDKNEIIKAPEFEEGHVNDIIDTEGCAMENKTPRDKSN